MKFVYPEGATPYNQDDSAALIPKHITIQKQLNEWEQDNIVSAERWLFTSNNKNILNIGFIKKLHKKMFDKTWKWAGKNRMHNTNIGIDYPLIQESLKNLCDDVDYWIENKVFPIDEVAARFHSKLVFIHAFPNGNGRHARLMTDALLRQLGESRFTWGSKSLSEQSNVRSKYIESLKEADKENIRPLLYFVRS